MVGLVFGISVVQSGEELFGELEFAHVGVAPLLFEAIEVAEERDRSQCESGSEKGICEELGDWGGVL